MSPNLDSPVQTQMAVAVLNRTLKSDYATRSRTEGRIGWKRVFVQTDSGCVLGIELDRGDNAHTVKRKLQLALNVPTDESSLTYGDRVLKNDLTGIRNDSPLLLTRNFMHRSSSTPCLSPTGRDLPQRDRSGPIEILGCSFDCTRMKQVVKDVVKAIRNGVDPIPVHSGMGGAYYFRNVRGESVAIAKPTDEEPFAPNNPKGFVGKALGQPGLKRSVRVGETGFREVAAYLLDYDHFANVPPTVLVKITHSVFHVNEGGVECGGNNSGCKGYNVNITNKKATSKIASFQQFIQHDFDASDYGTSSFPVSAVHRIGILDIRIFNTDRHAGNLLVRKFQSGAGTGSDTFGVQAELIPIDHGLCLPESLEDPYFEWIHWPQASIPFSDEELEYIAKLDHARDAEKLRTELPMMREASLRVLVVSTIFLKEAVRAGLCLAEIGEMMSRQFTGKEEEPSELEVICIEARKLVSEREEFLLEDSKSDDKDEDLVQFQIDCEDDPITPKTPPFYNFGSRLGSSRNPLSKLHEAIEEEEEEGEEDNRDEDITKFEQSAFNGLVNKWVPAIAKLSTSLKCITLGGKTKEVTKGNKGNNSGGASGLKGGTRSADEQAQASASFVKLGDMGVEEWELFLEKFRELLPDAFRDRKCRSFAQRQMQRLGTSCQF
ncbi:phosphatidylinositol 4-kinase gamma 7-like protein [Carex littledalei]|uniref:1-phosphatidylinositol 4-kinase n=1 Tax=Carex littledalei TaxID=544730 RepID=A0A833QMJ6_9POAL|nr:phosphatidylinositol 4-kinase gamma 7-like protein [Carex littledalei]